MFFFLFFIDTFGTNGADQPNSTYGSLMRPRKLLPLLRSSDQNGRSAGGLIPGEFLVRLRRQAGGFGFKLLGGAEEGTQVRQHVIMI